MSFVSHNGLNFAGLGVGIALHADGLAWTFARARIGRGALAADWQSAPVADSAIAVDGLEALKIALHFAAKIAFDDNLERIDRMDDGIQLLGQQFFGPDVRVNVGDFQDASRITGTDTVNVGERSFDALVTGNLYSKKAWHNVFEVGFGKGQGVQPCFCLCRGLVQTTRTTFLRRTILQFSQRRFTEARTFI